MHFVLDLTTAALPGGVIRISDKSSGINPATTRGFTGEDGVDVDDDVIVEATCVDEELT